MTILPQESNDEKNRFPHSGQADLEQLEMENSMSEQETRLRPHPAERFAGECHVFDLNRALDELRAEAHAAKSGHRQVTIFHRAPVTKVLFAFEPGGQIAEHAAHGLVTIHAIEGRFTVQ